MLKVLIAEDNFMISDLAEEFLVQHNYTVCGIASTVAKSVALARWHRPNIIILDQKLGGYGLGTDVAASLSMLPSIGILYVTGSVGSVLDTATHGHACLAKPYLLDDLLRSIEIVTEMVSSGAPPQPPFPHGFWVLPLAVSATNA